MAVSISGEKFGMDGTNTKSRTAIVCQMANVCLYGNKRTYTGCRSTVGYVGCDNLETAEDRESLPESGIELTVINDSGIDLTTYTPSSEEGEK
ncbi:MAG: hypothetical protein PHF67_00780 [Candidatus Nanoarchaeia archaeon]|nr:hypothetical protein [Candidatus Nanoarchaeia archaeon]